MAQKRIMRMVDQDEWRVSDALGAERVRRLKNPPSPDALLDQIAQQAERSARKRALTLKWQQSSEKHGYARLGAQVPLEEETFDWLFNGRSGYRAQYYLSPEEGVLYNHDILTRLLPALKLAYDAKPLCVPFKVVKQSVRAPHAKVWIFEDQAAFNAPPCRALTPKRWIKCGAKRGLKAPLPSHWTMDVKGAFIRPKHADVFVDELKRDRACDLSNMGFV